MITKEIADFISANIVGTLCCTVNDSPWCFNYFYLFIEEEGLLVLKSSDDSRHSAIMKKNCKVAGTILPTNINFAVLQGVQFEGEVIREEYHRFPSNAAELYHKKFPIGADMPGHIWTIELGLLKFTDNGKGFGYKSIWNRN